MTNIKFIEKEMLNKIKKLSETLNIYNKKILLEGKVKFEIKVDNSSFKHYF